MQRALLLLKLEMVSAMTRRTMLTVIMMVEIAVGHVLTQSIAQNVHAMVMLMQMEFKIHWLGMVTAMMR